MLKNTRVFTVFSALLVALSMSSTGQAKSFGACEDVFGIPTVTGSSRSKVLNELFETLLRKPIVATSKASALNVFRGLNRSSYELKVSSGGVKKRVEVYLELTKRMKIQFGPYRAPEVYQLVIERSQGDDVIDRVTLPFERMWPTEDGRTIRYSRKVMTYKGERMLVAKIHQGYAFNNVYSFEDLVLELQP